MKILLMEDDIVLGNILESYLSLYYHIDRVYDSQTAQEKIDEITYDMFIFDINVNGKNGIELLHSLRGYKINTPTIFITAYDDIRHLQEAFDAGAHDYVRKPFEVEEIKLRIERSKVMFNIEQFDDINLDKDIFYTPHRRIIYNKTSKSIISPKEAELLDYFLLHPNRLITPEEIFQNIWNYDNIPSDATLRSYIRKLREAIGHHKIITQRGLGYIYE